MAVSYRWLEDERLEGRIEEMRNGLPGVSTTSWGTIELQGLVIHVLRQSACPWGGSSYFMLSIQQSCGGFCSFPMHSMLHSSQAEPLLLFRSVHIIGPPCVGPANLCWSSRWPYLDTSFSVLLLRFGAAPFWGRVPMKFEPSPSYKP